MTSSMEVMGDSRDGLRSALRQIILQPMDIILAIGNVRLGDQGFEQRNRGVDAVDHEFAKRPLQPHQAFIAGARMHDQLADQAVIVRWDGVAGIGARIDAHTETSWRMEMRDLPRRGAKGTRILGVDPAFDGMAVEANVLLLERKRRARGDADLLDDEVDAGYHLGHGMLDLEPGIHLDEEELPALVQELDSAHAAIA